MMETKLSGVAIFVSGLFMFQGCQSKTVPSGAAEVAFISHWTQTVPMPQGGEAKMTIEVFSRPPQYRINNSFPGIASDATSQVIDKDSLYVWNTTPAAEALGMHTSVVPLTPASRAYSMFWIQIPAGKCKSGGKIAGRETLLCDASHGLLPTDVWFDRETGVALKVAEKYPPHMGMPQGYVQVRECDSIEYANPAVEMFRWPEPVK